MILYISKAFEEDIATTTHYTALKDIAGEENVYAIDLRPGEAYEKKNYKAYGKYLNRIERVRRWSQGNMMFISNSIIKEILTFILKNNVRIVFIDDSVFGNLVREIKKHYPNVKVISFYLDIKADLYKQWMRHGNLIDKIEYGIGIRQEYINQEYCDVNLVFNSREEELFKTIYGKLPQCKIPMSTKIPEILGEYKQKIATTEEKKKLLFVGKNYYPNLIGLRWFLDKVLPYLSNKICVNVVGRGLEFLRDEIQDDRVNVIGGVESLAPCYLDADIVIAPLFDGGGMKMKTVEAISFGKNFVGTKESLTGFWDEMDDSVRYKSVFQYETPEEWIHILNELTDGTIDKFNEKVYEVFVEKFSYESAREKIRKILAEL